MEFSGISMQRDTFSIVILRQNHQKKTSIHFESLPATTSSRQSIQSKKAEQNRKETVQLEWLLDQPL